MPLPAAFRGAGAIDAARPTPGRWWTVFADAELDALISAALSGNLTIRQAAYRLEASRALVRPAWAQGAPQIF